MRLDQVDTLIDQLEDYIKSLIHVEISKSQGYDQMAAASEMILDNMRTSLKEYICDLLKLKATRTISDDFVTRDTTDNLKCPECGSDMIQRKNKQTGNIFYGCRKFPECKGTRDENGLSREERNAQKESVTQQDGFSFKRQPWKESGPTG